MHFLAVYCCMSKGWMNETWGQRRRGCSEPGRHWRFLCKALLYRQKFEDKLTLLGARDVYGLHKYSNKGGIRTAAQNLYNQRWINHDFYSDCETFTQQSSGWQDKSLMSHRNRILPLIIPSFLLSQAPSLFSSAAVSQRLPPFSRESDGVCPTGQPFSTHHAHHFLSSFPLVCSFHLFWPVRSPSNTPPVPFYLCGGGVSRKEQGCFRGVAPMFLSQMLC